MFKKLALTALVATSFIPAFFLVKTIYNGVKPASAVLAKDTGEVLSENSTASSLATTQEATSTQDVKVAIETPKKSSEVPNTVVISDSVLPTNTDDVEVEKQAQNMVAQVISVAPVVQKPDPLTTPFVFLESLIADWNIETSSAHVDTKSSYSYEGTYGIHATFDAALGEVRLKSAAGVDAKNYDGINLYIVGGLGGERITMTLYDDQGKKLGSQNISRYLQKGHVTRDFAQMYISFLPLKASHSVVSEIVFQSEKSGDIYLDNITFTNTPMIRPTSGKGDTYAPEVFIDELVNGWEIPAMGRDTRIYEKDGMGGTPTIQTTFTAAGESVDFHQEQGMYTYSFRYLTFWAKGQALGDTIYVRLKDSNGTEFGKMTLGDFVKNTSNYTEFQKISIPLVYLGAENVIINNIIFTSREGTSRELDLDDIKFESY